MPLLSSFVPVADQREIGKIVDLSAAVSIILDVGEKIGFTLFVVFKLKSSRSTLWKVRLVLLFTALGGESLKEEVADRLLLL